MSTTSTTSTIDHTCIHNSVPLVETLLHVFYSFPRKHLKKDESIKQKWLLEESVNIELDVWKNGYSHYLRKEKSNKSTDNDGCI